MGSFSWLKADKLTKVKNVVCGHPFKLLIPKEFGGGFIKDKYQDYGYLGTKENGEPKYDMYELLAFWNADMVVDCDTVTYQWVDGKYVRTSYPSGTKVRDMLKYDGDFPSIKEIDKYTDINRGVGIDIGCYKDEIDKLKYPLKLVSASYTGTYEDCKGKSYGDSNQGFGPVYRD